MQFQKPTTPEPVEPTEVAVYSGAGSGCYDDEDDCDTSNNEKRNFLICAFIFVKMYECFLISES